MCSFLRPSTRPSTDGWILVVQDEESGCEAVNGQKSVMEAELTEILFLYCTVASSNMKWRRMRAGGFSIALGLDHPLFSMTSSSDYSNSVELS
jgi:hypothetical protein